MSCSLSRARNNAACSATRFSSRSAIRSRFKPRTDAAWSLADVAALSVGAVIAGAQQYADSHAGSVRDVGSHAA
jgi:hypothetical protein